MTRYKFDFVTIIILIVAVVSLSLPDVPRIMNFQGKLYDSAGNPLTGDYSITFRIYAVETGGTSLCGETIIVSCDEGLYTVSLGLTTPLNLIFDGPHWLGVQVSGDTELSPRYRLVSVPGAFRAVVAESSATAAYAQAALVAVDSDKLDGKHAVAFADSGHHHDGRYYTQDSLNTSDGNAPNVGANIIHWDNLWGVPGGFADGTDDVGAAGGVSQVNAGTCIAVLNPTGPTAAIAHAADASALPDAHHTKTIDASELTAGTLDNALLHMGHNNGINADMVDGKHANTFADTGHHHNDLYYTEGELYTNDGTVNETADPVSWYKIKDIPAGFADGEDNEDGGSSNWTVTNSILSTNEFWGITRGGAGNAHLIGDPYQNMSHTIVNFGEICTTGTSNPVGAHGYQTVSGGYHNVAIGPWSTIGGGDENRALDNDATIGGGWQNIAGMCGTVGGGSTNRAIGDFSTVPGGSDNDAEGEYSFAAGRRAKALHNGAFVWADATNTTFTSTGENQFLVRASNGMGIGTTDPKSPLSFGNSLGDKIGLYESANSKYGFGIQHYLLQIYSDTDRSDIAFGYGSSTDFSENMRIKGNGNIGIGTPNPETTLHVKGAANPVLFIQPDEWNSAGDYGEIRFGDLQYHYIRGEFETGTTFYDVNKFQFLGGNVGIGTDDPTDKLAVINDSQEGLAGYFRGAHGGIEAKANTEISSGNKWGVTAEAESQHQFNNCYGVWAFAYGYELNFGVYGEVYGKGTEYTNWAGYFNDNVRVVGNINPSSGLSEIDHPLDPENKYLYHSFVGSPEMKNVYDGVVVLNVDGEAIVALPHYFDAYNKDFRYQLTPVGSPAPSLYIAREISNNRFTIAGGKPGMKVSWQVTGIRKDAYANAHHIQVEKSKSASDRGKYLHPEEHGQPEQMGIDYQNSLKRRRK